MENINEYIRLNYQKQSDAEIAAKLGVTKKAISGRRYRMGLSKEGGQNGQQTSVDGINAIAKLLQERGVTPDNLGNVSQAKFSQWGSEDNLKTSTSVVLKLSPKWEEGPEWPLVQQAKPTIIKPFNIAKKDRKVKRAMIFPDVQIGYRLLKDFTFDPFHDERAMSVALAITKDVNPDLMINLGDFMDFAEFGRFTQEASFAHTTQKSVNRGHDFLAEQIAVAPNAEDYVVMEGNHDCLTEDIKAVTKRGSVSVNELRQDDKVMSVDDDGNTTWLPINAVIKKHYQGNVVGVRSHNVNYRVTPNHRIVGKDSKHQWKEWLAKNLQEDYVAIVAESGHTLESRVSLNDRYEEEYDGTVWCVNVDNGRFFVDSGGFISLTGNCRLPNMIQDNAKSAWGLQQANTPESWPILSVPHLLRFDDLGVTYVDGYPAGEYYINDRIRVEHGDKTGPRGKIAAKIVQDERMSVITGHTHRIEEVYKTTNIREGSKVNAAYTMGCLCRIDGAVPSTNGATDSLGNVKIKYEDWQQAVGIVEYVPGDGPFSVRTVLIHEGSAVFEGKVYTA